MNRYVKYLLFGIFLAAVLLIVFLQFNSTRSIDKLIYGNENLLRSAETRNELQQLLTELQTLENRLRSTILSPGTPSASLLDTESASVRRSLAAIDSTIADTTIQLHIDRLHQLVETSIGFSYSVMDTLRAAGKQPAIALDNRGHSRLLYDTIRQTIGRIDSLHQLHVTALIEAADRNGRKAKTLGTILAVIAALASVFAFGYVTYKIRQQQLLIERLDQSEKKARMAAQVKENFLANMSHEIRTPLNAILGFTDLLQQQRLEKDSTEFVQTIHRAGENLLAIVNDVLDLSKIESGMMRIEPTPFSLRVLVHSVISMYAAKTAEKNIRLDYSIDPSVPDDLVGDTTRINQVLVNLLSNAVKFTEAGSIQLDIQCSNKDADPLPVRFEVSDTGAGIHAADLPRIFERFNQAEEQVTRKYGGTGLGLAIVKDIVSLLGGTIGVRSEPGTGSCFTVEIPLYKNPHAAALPKQEQPPYQPANAARTLSILAVEDNEINQSLLDHLCRKWQFAIQFASNGQAALTALRSHSFDLLLMDIQMPEMDGYTATREIRNHLRLQVPIIAMTAYAMPGEREKCISSGMNEYIAKPIKEAELYRLILQCTGQAIQPSASLAQTGTLPATYQYIQLDYMRMISEGDTAYERTVTSQFIETVPADLLALQQLYAGGQQTALQQRAHNMKTTVAVMGLDQQLNPLLDQLEQGPLSPEAFNTIYTSLSAICTGAVTEARLFLQLLPA